MTITVPAPVVWVFVGAFSAVLLIAVVGMIASRKAKP